MRISDWSSDVCSSDLEVDRTDLRILRELQKDGRLPIVELANHIALSATACQRRVKKLEDSGVIAGYAALLDPVALGQQVDAFVRVSIERQSTDTIGRASCRERVCPYV